MASKACPDATQTNPKSPYYDAKSKREAPRWLLVDVKLAKKTCAMPLEELRGYPELADMVVLKRGNRLSITPVTPAEWQAVLALLETS